MGLLDFIFSKRVANDPPGHSNQALTTVDAVDFEDKGEDRDPRFDGWRLWITYSDFEGATSQRWVRVYRIVARRYADYLVGHCELRNSTRTFRIDRIMEVADRDGELHEPSDFFRPYLSEVEGRSAGPDRHRGFGRALKIVDLIGDYLKVLAFVAEADGRIGRKEADILMKFASVRATELGLDLNKTDVVDLRKWLKVQNPDPRTMRATIGRIATKGSMTLDEIWELADIVVGIDGKVTKTERQAMAEVRSALEEEFATIAKPI